MTDRSVLNLGAGVQSTTLYLMAIRGEAPAVEAAIFADTGEEPTAVYIHLEWLKSLNGPPIIVRSAGQLGEDLLRGKFTSNGSRFAQIPAFTTADQGDTVGRTRRQCSKEYKTEVIERAIRRDVLGLKPRQRIPKGVRVHQYFGISLDEAGRATRIYERFHVTDESKYEPHFPLIDRAFTRANCIEWLEQHGNVPHVVPRSACVFCPFHTDQEWQRLKDANGADWARAVAIDTALRTSGTVAARDMEQVMYVHRSCQPLTQITFRPRENRKELQLGFGLECEGVCGV